MSSLANFTKMALYFYSLCLKVNSYSIIHVITLGNSLFYFINNLNVFFVFCVFCFVFS